MSREDAYAAVQSAAMRTWEALGTPDAPTFRDMLLADPAVRARLDPAALDLGDGPEARLRASGRDLRPGFHRSVTQALRRDAFPP